jgi:serine/threonine-protein kinase
MERLHGTDLSTLVDRAGPLPPARTIHLLRQVCCSLAEAHQAGLIHRDVKPANIFICRQALVFDFVKVLDFGLVKAGARQQSVELTQAGTMLGTPLYMAPEMIKGQDVDGRADLYSLGCVAYWLLTGKPPFDADTITAVVASHLTEEPPSPRSMIGSGIPESLDGLIVRCMAKNPDDRPQSAEQLEEELASCSDQSPWTQEEARACWDQIDLTASAGETSTRSPSDAATVEHVLKLPE